MMSLLRGAPSKDASATLNALDRAQAILEFSMDGRILSANRRFLDLTGYTAHELEGRQRSILLPKDGREEDDHTVWSRLRAGEPHVAEIRCVARDGRLIWLQASCLPVTDKGGKPYKIVQIANDITASKLSRADMEGQIAAIDRSQAVIEFDLDGTIRTANAQFLNAMGYGLEEIAGRHHSIFVLPEEREGADYKAFWDALRRGEYRTGEFRRIGKGGKTVWIQASYNPILDLDGKPCKVVKFASDITARKRAEADLLGQFEAIGKSQAVIEFELDGTIRTANAQFLNAMGYSLAEVQGRRHAMFIAPSERDGAAYKAFWDALRRGEYQSGEYRRLGRDGREVWIQASYNPILDPDGKPYKVVKFASDVTAQVLARKRAEHIGKMMEAVAAGARELHQSVEEISQSMALSRNSTTLAFDQVMGADAAISQLSDAAGSMGQVLEAIDDITGQINLLALNATIESARAGEAGRGFAVVANEVKNLANQARTATGRITESIDGMQSMTDRVVTSLGSIRKAMEEVMGHVSGTAAAVEQQSSVAQDMSETMQRAAAEASGMG